MCCGTLILELAAEVMLLKLTLASEEVPQELEESPCP